MMKLRLLEVHVQPVFVLEHEGEIEKVEARPATLNPKQWKEFINGGWEAERQRLEKQLEAELSKQTQGPKSKN